MIRRIGVDSVVYNLHQTSYSTGITSIGHNVVRIVSAKLFDGVARFYKLLAKSPTDLSVLKEASVEGGQTIDTKIICSVLPNGWLATSKSSNQIEFNSTELREGTPTHTHC